MIDPVEDQRIITAILVGLLFFLMVLEILP